MMGRLPLEGLFCACGMEDAMLAAIVGGTTDSATLANLARGKLRSKREQLERARG